MKPIPYLAGIVLLALSSCSSAYKTTQTPDDVYYSPRVKPAYAASNDNNRQDNNANYTDASDGGTYVTYDDEDEGDYSRRINLFNSNYSGSYYDYYSPNIYSGYYGSPYYGSSWGMSMGWGGYYGSRWGSPFYGSYWGGPSISIGLGWGWGGYYDPWMYSGWGYGGWGYNPWYYGGYYGGYYGRYYGYPGWGHGSYGYVTPNRGYRTRNSYSSGGGRVVGGNYVPGSGGRVRGDRNSYQPGGRTSDGSGGRISDGSSRGSRVIRNGGSDNSGGRVNGDSYYQPRRTFTPSSSERPVYNDGGGRGSYTPPQRTYQPQSTPQRSYQPSSPSYSPGRSSGGGSIGGGGGGGRSSGGSRGGRN